MAGALEASDRRISTTERLSDRKLTRLKAHRGTPEVGCHDNREKVLVLDGLRDLSCGPCAWKPVTLENCSVTKSPTGISRNLQVGQ